MMARAHIPKLRHLIYISTLPFPPQFTLTSISNYLFSRSLLPPIPLPHNTFLMHLLKEGGVSGRLRQLRRLSEWSDHAAAWRSEKPYLAVPVNYKLYFAPGTLSVSCEKSGFLKFDSDV